METTWRLTGFAAALLVVLALAFGAGRAVGPLDDDGPAPSPTHTMSPAPHDQRNHDEGSHGPGTDPDTTHPTGSD